MGEHVLHVSDGRDWWMTARSYQLHDETDKDRVSSLPGGDVLRSSVMELSAEARSSKVFHDCVSA